MRVHDVSDTVRGWTMVVRIDKSEYVGVANGNTG